MKAFIMALERQEGMGEGGALPNSCMGVFEGRHLIQYSLDAAIECKVEEILIAVGRGAEEIINAFGITYRDIRIKYVLLKEEHGFLDALRLSREALEHDDFIIFKGDEIVRNAHLYEMIENFYRQELFIECGVVPLPAAQIVVRGYGLMYDPFDYRVYRIVDKPRRAINHFMGTSVCVFRNEIVEYLEPVYSRESRERDALPDLVQSVIDDGYPVKLFVLGSACVGMNAVSVSGVSVSGSDVSGSDASESGDVEQGWAGEPEYKLELEPVF